MDADGAGCLEEMCFAVIFSGLNSRLPPKTLGRLDWKRLGGPMDLCYIMNGFGRKLHPTCQVFLLSP